VPAGASLDAHIETNANLNYGYTTGSYGARLADNVTVTIQLLRSQSWAKKQRINGWPQPAQADLLRHEQGHYDITALMGRDMFIELMALKTRTFSSLSALETEIRAVGQRYAPQRIHTKYDSSSETDHGRKAAEQRLWDGYLRSAFTQVRTPAVHAPDGTAYKVTLLSVLRRAGKIT
jgi:predicted secreted Zn-dependent protease